MVKRLLTGLLSFILNFLDDPILTEAPKKITAIKTPQSTRTTTTTTTTTNTKTTATKTTATTTTATTTTTTTTTTTATGKQFDPSEVHHYTVVEAKARFAQVLQSI